PEPRSPSAAAGSYHPLRPAPRAAPSAAAADAVSASLYRRLGPPPPCRPGAGVSAGSCGRRRAATDRDSLSPRRKCLWISPPTTAT
ncbi:hypothetical protein EE612_053680, partial [Oryza sativa]